MSIVHQVMRRRHQRMWWRPATHRATRCRSRPGARRHQHPHQHPGSPDGCPASILERQQRVPQGRSAQDSQFRKRPYRCPLTVRAERHRHFPISLLVRPAAASSATARSWTVSGRVSQRAELGGCRPTRAGWKLWFPARHRPVRLGDVDVRVHGWVRGGYTK